MNDSWSEKIRYLLLVICLILGAVFVYTIRSLIGPLIISALLAYLLYPVVLWLKVRLGGRKKLAVFIVYSIFIGLLLAVPAGFTPFIISQINTLNSEIGTLQTTVEQALAQIQLWGLSFPGGELPVDLQAIFTELLHPQQIIDFVSIATENIVLVFMILITTYYLLLDWERLAAWGLEVIPVGFREDANRLFGRIKIVWRVYLRGQLLLMLVLGVASGVGALAVGLPGAVIIGLLAAILALVPSFGSSTMAIIATIVGLLTGSTYMNISHFWFGVIVLGLFVAIHLVENYWLRPSVMEHRLQLHPALVIISVIGALSLAGVLAVLIIVPLISTVDILGKYVYRRIFALAPWPEEEKDNSQ
jgi:predicted PurR-regulated permease PerM